MPHHRRYTNLILCYSSSDCSPSVEAARAFYLAWYDRIWTYSWQHLVDRRHGDAVFGGPWYRLVSRDNRPLDDLKSPPGKVEFHVCGACYEASAALTELERRRQVHM